jgi:hypothetical protein
MTIESALMRWPIVAYLAGALCAAIAAYRALSETMSLDWAAGTGICLVVGLLGRKIQDVALTSVKVHFSLGGRFVFVGLCVLSGLLSLGFLMAAPSFGTAFSEGGLTVPLATELAVGYADWLVVPLTLAWCGQLVLTTQALTVRSRVAIKYAIVIAGADFLLAASLFALLYLPLVVLHS